MSMACPAEGGVDTAMMMAGPIPPPIFSFSQRGRKKRKRAVDGPKEKKAPRGYSWSHNRNIPAHALIVQRGLVVIDLAYFSFRCRFCGGHR